MDSVEEIKSRLSVDEVVGSYIQLKPAGTNLRGLCPFHNEKTPSFMVSPEKGIWHCFGCGEGGDMFTFVEKMEGLDFKAVLEKLATKAGVTLEASTPGAAKHAKQKERLLVALELATKYFQTGLVKSKTAQNYIIRTRGFNKSTVETFRLGFSPDAQTGLSNQLLKKGFSKDEIVNAGLARKKDSGLQDIFRGRMMVPFMDAQSRTIGFTGRHIIDDAFGPKYLNTPATALFDKSRFIFGLSIARDSIREKDEVVVSEGNLDVLTSFQSGVKNVVASSGTALTLAQLKTLSRITKNVKLAFDQDKAGLTATERVIPLAQDAGVTLSIVNLSGAKDPDELIHQSPKTWEKAIAQAPYIMDWLLDNLVQKFSVTSATGKKQISDAATASISKLSDSVEQDHYVKKLAKLLQVSTDSIWQKLDQQAPATTPRNSRAKVQAKSEQRPESQTVEEALLAINLMFPDSRTSLDELSSEHFSSVERQAIFEALRELEQKSIVDSVPESLLPLENYVKILLLRAEEEYRDWATLDRRIEAFSLSQRLGVLYIKHLKQKLANEIHQAEGQGDNKRRDELLSQFRDLN